MDSFDQSNCDTSVDIEPKRKKRRMQNEFDDEREEFNLHQLDEDDSPNAAYHQPVMKRWGTVRKQQIYTSKLLQAIRHVRRRSLSARTGKEYRQTADRVLAGSAKGATRWSRAILSSPRSVRLRKRQVKVKVARCNRLRRKQEDAMGTKKKKKLSPVQKKLRVLSRLIPGCRKVSSLNLLEEATDYIPALEMQVRALNSLTSILAGASPVDVRLVLNLNS